MNAHQNPENLCYVCHDRIPYTVLSKNIQIQICQNCRESDNTIVTKVYAKNRFCLNDEDMKELKYNIIYDKYKRKNFQYSYQDVLELAIRKYSSIQDLMVEQEKRKLLRNQRKLNKADKIETEQEEYKLIQDKRKRDLDTDIANLLLEDIRYSDVPEYFKYIELGHKSGYHKDDIIEIIKENNFLKKHTNYEKIYNKLVVKQLDFVSLGSSSFIDDEAEITYSARRLAIKKYIDGNGDVTKIPLGLIKQHENLLKAN